MKKFAQRFDKPLWDLCCQFPEFVEQVDKDLEVAEALAVKFLTQTLEGWNQEFNPFQ